ncbi:MAG: YggT family protein [Actinobacteria bacterium]|jgi:YggT family protein|nr:MAG: YggT family protein [Actinomycetota bacterium]TMK92125.1 MAG: YggT family protein [Actinomycetota bacterium]
MTGLICIALWVATLLLLARVVVSWLEFFGVRRPIVGPGRTAWDLLYDVTEPALRPLRRIIPPAGMFDISVIVAFVIIFVLRYAFC